MTQSAAAKEIETIKRIAEEALKSKESARQILVDAGILQEKKTISDNSKKKK
jgi:hypothetical protein